MNLILLFLIFICFYKFDNFDQQTNFKSSNVFLQTLTKLTGGVEPQTICSSEHFQYFCVLTSSKFSDFSVKQPLVGLEIMKQAFPIHILGSIVYASAKITLHNC